MQHLLIITFLVLYSVVGIAQESFKKKYLLPCNLGDRMPLKIDRMVAYDSLIDTEQREIDRLYPIDSTLSYNVEEVIDGKKAMVRKTIKVDTSFLKRQKKKITSRVLSQGNCVYLGAVKVVKNRLIVNPWLDPSPGSPLAQQGTFYYQLKNRVPVRLKFKEYTASALVIPIKYRFRDRGDSIPEMFTANLNANLMFGKTFRGRTKILYRENMDPISNTWKYTAGLLIGASTVTLTSKNTSGRGEAIEEEAGVMQGVFTTGGALLFSFNKINLGVSAGLDFAIGDDGYKWNYHKQPWLGLTVGYDILKL